MEVTSASISGQTIVLTGTNFPTSGYTASGSFNGTSATSATIDSASTATLTFSAGGIPFDTDAAPSINFTSTSDSSVLVPVVDSTVLLTNTPSITAGTNGLQCSFSGGCYYSLTGDGLFAALLQDGNEIQMCHQTCQLDSSASSASQATCRLPMLPTTYSVSNYMVEEAKVLNASSYSPSDNYLDLFDYVLTVDHSDSASSDCEMGMTFKDGYQVVLTEAKLFINTLLDKTPYVGNLVFQGSNDGWTTSTDLYTFDVNVHEGWNYIRFGLDEDGDGVNDPKPSYNSYRFLGAVAGSCRVGEMRLTGVEAIASDTSTQTCTP